VDKVSDFIFLAYSSTYREIVENRGLTKFPNNLRSSGEGSSAFLRQLGRGTDLGVPPLAFETKYTIGFRFCIALRVLWGAYKEGHHVSE
jgi:hypothetical protein